MNRNNEIELKNLLEIVITKIFVFLVLKKISKKSKINIFFNFWKWKYKIFSIFFNIKFAYS